MLIYVDTGKQVGDPEHPRRSQTRAPRRPGSGRTMRQLFQGRASCAGNRRAAFEYEVPE